MNLLDALDSAVEEFGLRMAQIQPSDWVRPTPCDDWDVHYLVAHVIGGNRFAAAVLGGMTSSDAIDEVMSRPQLGSEPMTDWAAASNAQAAAFRSDGRLDRLVDHPMGMITGERFAEYRLFDISLHAWDLARSIDADDELASELVDDVLAIVERDPQGLGFGIEALPGAHRIASPQARLLALTGRSTQSAIERG